MTARIYVAIAPDEFARLYDEPTTTTRLETLGEIVFGEVSAGKVPVPGNVAESFDVLLTSWSTARFEPGILSAPAYDLPCTAPDLCARCSQSRFSVARSVSRRPGRMPWRSRSPRWLWSSQWPNCKSLSGTTGTSSLRPVCGRG